MLIKNVKLNYHHDSPVDSTHWQTLASLHHSFPPLSFLLLSFLLLLFSLLLHSFASLLGKHALLLRSSSCCGALCSCKPTITLFLARSRELHVSSPSRTLQLSNSFRGRSKIELFVSPFSRYFENRIVRFSSIWTSHSISYCAFC